MRKKSRVTAFWLSMIVVVFAAGVLGEEKKEGTALLLIDIQHFYFPGGRSELVDPESAALKAKKLLEKFREKKLLVVHVRHNAKTEAEIHKSVLPLDGEKIVSKDNVNCFKNTDLLEYLRAHRIGKCVICGMMTHMCVEAAVRAAHDYDFEVTLVHDACATRALVYKGREISAADVQLSTLRTLDRYYARVVDTETFLEDFLNFNGYGR